MRGWKVNLSAKGRLVDPALVVDATLLELLEGIVKPVVESGSLPALQLPNEDVLEATLKEMIPCSLALGL